MVQYKEPSCKCGRFPSFALLLMCGDWRYWLLTYISGGAHSGLNILYPSLIIL